MTSILVVTIVTYHLLSSISTYFFLRKCVIFYYRYHNDQSKKYHPMYRIGKFWYANKVIELNDNLEAEKREKAAAQAILVGTLFSPFLLPVMLIKLTILSLQYFTTNSMFKHREVIKELKEAEENEAKQAAIMRAANYKNQFRK